MSEKVNIRLEMDPSCSEPEVIIRTDRQTELTEKIISAVKRCLVNEYPPVMAYQRDNLVFVAQSDIIRIFTENRKLIFCTETGQYELRQPLKELEEKLDKEHFVRISRFEIVNLRKVSGFDFSNMGTIRVLFQGGSETWVARRYIQSIQQALKHLEAREGDDSNV